MITELRLENWKSFGEATLYIDPLSILIGTNASGKSNVLDALQFLQNIASGMTARKALTNLRGGEEWVLKKNEEKFSIEIMFNEKEKKRYKYCIRYYIDTNDSSIAEHIFGMDDNGEQLVSFAGHTLDELMLPGKMGEVEIKYENIRSPSEFIAYNLKKIFCLNPKPLTMRGYSLLSNLLWSDASNIAGVLAALSVERQKEIEDTLTQYASRLPERDIHRVYAEKVGKLGKDAMLYCDEKWGESGEVFTVDARAMSDGTLRFLAILTALLTLPEGSLLAIDEVDNGFHPSRAHLLLEALQTIGKQRNIDILVTTHNPALLDALGTEFVPFVTVAHRDSITGESKLTLLEDIEQLPKLLAQGTVGKLSTQGLIEKSLESVHG